FFTDARIPADNVIGDVNGGWRVAVTTLMFERRGAALMRPRFASTGGRTVAEAVPEADEDFATYPWYPARAGPAEPVLWAPPAAPTRSSATSSASACSACRRNRPSTATWRSAPSRATRRPSLDGSLRSLPRPELRPPLRRCAAHHPRRAGAQRRESRGAPATG